MTWLLNLFGEREWSIIWHGGEYFAVEFSEMYQRRHDGIHIMRSNLTQAAAQHLARKLRHNAENTPRDVM